MKIMRLSKFFLLALLVSMVLASCSNERVGCNGKIIVENPIPDTTLYVGGENFVRDLNQSPKVFSHTNGEIKNYLAAEENPSIAKVSMEESAITGNLDVIVVEAKSQGQTLIEITATDDCPDGGTTTSFNVTVRDTTQ